MTWLLALLGGAAAFAQPMHDNHQLTSLWKQYQQAYRADRPQKQAQILTQIKQEASAKHLPLDFYDAATEYVRTEQSRNWKLRDQLYKDLAAEVAAFGEPIVTFRWMKEWDSATVQTLWDYVKAHPDGFNGHHPDFYTGVSDYLNGSLQPFIQNDHEYVLWALLGKIPASRLTESEVYKALRENVEGRYPAHPALEFFVLLSTNSKAEDFEALAAKYPGKAISLYPRARVLQLKKSALDKGNGTSEQYKALCGEADALEKERGAYKGDEAVIAKGCTAAAELRKTLRSESILVSLDNRKIVVALRNLDHADVTLYVGEKKQVWNLQNTVKSFYVKDTLTVDLPALSDGTYTVEAKCGGDFDIDTYEQHTLSVASLQDSRGRCVYVTDYETGIPLRTATLILYKNEKEVARTDMALNGFTPLPEAFVKAIGDGVHKLEAVSGQRKSRQMSLFSSRQAVTYDEHLRCNIFRDRGAYNPGDVVNFKAIVFNGDPEKYLEVVPGKEVEVRLHDTEDNVIETKKLTTNAYGAVSGSFTLPKGLRNGRFEIEVVGLGYDAFRVDEFELPTFDLTFDKIDKLYLSGDEVPVSGRLVSYSGHSLSDVKLTARISRYSSLVKEESVPVKEDNTFSVLFPSDAGGYYQVEILATDPSGETRSFRSSYYIGSSLSVEARLDDEADDELVLPDVEDEWHSYDPRYTIETQILRLHLQARDGGHNAVPLPVEYKITKADGTPVASGTVASGDLLTVELPSDGVYCVTAEVSAQKADGTKVTGTRRFRVLSLPRSEKRIGKEVTRVFVAGPLTVAEGGALTARIGSGEGDAYAVVSIYGRGGQLLKESQVRVVDGTVEDLSFPYEAAWPDAVRLQVFYFIHGSAVTYDRQYEREKDRYALPLQFTRFQDKAYPGVKYDFTLRTAPGTEVLVAAWDKSLDEIAENEWPLVSLRGITVEGVYLNRTCGYVTGGPGDEYEYEVRAYGRPMMRAKSSDDMMIMDTAPMAEMAANVEEEAIPFQLVESKPSFGGYGEVNVRSDFAAALTFQPHLYPDAEGNLHFSFSTSDKLSTFYVRAYAHDKKMANAMVEGEMMVTLPVKVSLLEPRFLYKGDVYDAAVTLSSAAEGPVSGMLLFQAGELSQEVPVTVEPGQTVTHFFQVEALQTGDLTLKAVFKADDFSDAIQVTVPVYPAFQQLVEAHSAVLRAGEDREALLQELRSRFVNVPASEAQLSDVSILDMVKAAIPAHVDPNGNDVLSLSEAWYIRHMASRLGTPLEEGTDALLDKILACRNADGGFGWFEGMSSSPVITAVMLERFAQLRDRGMAVPDVTESVRYLDQVQLDETRPYWCGWLSDAQYMYVRASYPEVPFEVKPVTDTAKKRLKTFRKEAKAYLAPSKKDGRGLQGRILEKARRLATLQKLVATKEGTALAKAWGVSLSGRLKKSMKADVASLKEYAVEHRDGGWYYPNAVMPWRGLLESEAYAHAMLCNLLQATGDEKAASIADGIRLWLMLQKETQHWEAEPAFIDAITAILDGSDAVLQTRVLALSASYEKPFQDIKAAGNGFTIERKFFLEKAEGSQPIAEGDTLRVGDKVRIEYQIWNAENRSFVKVDAAHEASLTPEKQLSGHIGYSYIRPWGDRVVFGFVPQGYRNVKADRTEFFFDSYPEEKTTLSETYFVTRAGCFQAPVVTIESLYAQHYRANDGASARLLSR